MDKILEFVLPILFASTEAMLWVLLVVVLIILGRGRLAPSERALLIERKGQYRMALAPGLNLAQPFVEAIAEQASLHGGAIPDGAPLCFEVRDTDVATRKRPAYLLSISGKDGLLHFDVMPPAAGYMPARQTENRLEELVRAVGEARGIRLHCVSLAA